MEQARQPRIFIASSSKSLNVANAIGANVDHEAEVTVWTHFFDLSSNVLDDLLNKSMNYDFAIFVFTPDDVSKIRGENERVVRDNVVFELGLFLGVIGKDRCFVVKPRNVDLHIPTDLLGLIPTDYNAERSDGILRAAVNYPCTIIKERIADLGLLSSNTEVRKEEPQRISYNYQLGNVEHRLLAELLESHAAFPSGVSVVRTFNTLNRLGRHKLGLATAKLEKMGYLSKRNVRDDEGEYHVFFITEDGIDYMLRNDHLVGGSGYQIDTGSAAETSPDDDIPF